MITPWESSILNGALSVWLYGKLTINGELVINDNVEITGNNHLILPSHDDSATPTLAIGSSGIYEQSANIIVLATNNAPRVLVDASGNLVNATGDQWGLLNEGATATNPVIVAKRNDLDTGIGTAGADIFSIITGGVEAHRMTETGGAITHELTGDVNINGDLTADSFPFESISNLDKQSFENLLDNGDFKAWSDGDNVSPDCWSVGGTGAVSKESTIVKIAPYSYKLISGAAADVFSYNTNNTDVDFYTYYKGRTISFGAWAWCDTASKLKLRVYDGISDTDSAYHSGNSNWEFLPLTKTMSNSSNRMRATIFVGSGSITGYIGGAILVEGSVCPAFSPKPLSFIGWKSFPPFLDENSANVANKPTLVNRGLFGGYSLPEYAAGEELLYRMRVPHSWDGSTNPWFVAITSISANEDVGDKYKFQLEWQSEDIGAVIPDTVAETLTDEITVSNGASYYAEIVVFELDGSQLVAGQNLQARLRRIAASASSVSNEIIVWHWDTRWKMNKLGTESIQGY